MKKILKLEDLDCPNCLAKIENDVKKLDGVEAVSVNLLSQKMVLECDENKFTDLLKSVKKVVKKYEPDVEVHEL